MQAMLSKEKLNYFHNMLDKELQNVGNSDPLNSLFTVKLANKKYLDRNIQDSFLAKENTNSSSNSELEYLQKKLIELEMKMQVLSEEKVDHHMDQNYKQKEDKSKQSSKELARSKKIVSYREDIKEQPFSNWNITMSKKKKIEKQSVQQQSPLKRKYESIQLQSENKQIRKSKVESKREDNNHKDSKSKSAKKNMKQSLYQKNSISQRNKKSKNGSLNKKSTTSHENNIKVIFLQKEMNKLKSENKKLKSRVKMYEILAGEYKKLQENFEKSQFIRKQQKILLQNCKNKHSKFTN